MTIGLWAHLTGKTFHTRNLGGWASDIGLLLPDTRCFSTEAFATCLTRQIVFFVNRLGDHPEPPTRGGEPQLPNPVPVESSTRCQPTGTTTSSEYYIVV